MKRNHRIWPFNTHSYFLIEWMVAQLIFHVGGSSTNRAMVIMREFYAFLIQYSLDERNILLRCCRLFFQFIVDCYATIEAWWLLYIKNHQSTLRVELNSDLQDAITARKNC